MQFNIEKFHPSISKGLLMKTINHAKSFVTICYYQQRKSKNYNAFS